MTRAPGVMETPLAKMRETVRRADVVGRAEQRLSSGPKGYMLLEIQVESQLVNCRYKSGV